LATLYTIGHSTRTLEDLIATLRAHQIENLADIRAYPASRRLPQFKREALETSLPAAAIGYVWMKALGGYRKKILDDSPNIALRNDSFRNYADYMLTPEFEPAIAALVALGDKTRTAYMCAERVYFQCHRMLVSDWLVAHGHEVMHIDDARPARLHTLSVDARIIDGSLVYRGDRLF
jgi:uncharacterized protein (DUF488 family)